MLITPIHVRPYMLSFLSGPFVIVSKEDIDQVLFPFSTFWGHMLWDNENSYVGYILAYFTFKTYSIVHISS